MKFDENLFENIKLPEIDTSAFKPNIFTPTMPEYEIINQDETERAKATIRTAESMEKVISALNDITANINKLSDALETERQLRKEADRRQEAISEALYRLAIVTFIATIGAFAVALVALLS